MILNKLKQKIQDTILKPKPCEPDKNRCYTHFDSCYIHFNSSPPPKQSSQQNEATLAGRIGTIEVDLTLKENSTIHQVNLIIAQKNEKHIDPIQSLIPILVYTGDYHAPQRLCIEVQDDWVKIGSIKLEKNKRFKSLQTH